MRFALLIAGALLLSWPVAAQPHRSVRVQVIDRGQADGILIRTPNEKWILIDPGQDRLQDREAAKAVAREINV